MSKEILDAIQRKPRDCDEMMLFNLEADWHQHWWDMPAFEMQDASPQHKLVVNFMTKEDVVEFAKLLGINVTSKSNSAWFPNQQRLKGEYAWCGPATESKYPICIPSKGRADVQTTGKSLDKLGVKYNFFVESDEYENYCKHVGKDKVICMPFNNLGQGSVPARNFIWEWAKEKGYKRHWTLDDNLGTFVRLQYNRKLGVLGGGFFRAMEDYVDRYENIVMAGPHNRGFVPDRSDRMGPYLLNSRIYSCILLDTSLPDRWRGRYNEDTDLSLRLLKQGKCTLLFRAFLMDKGQTVGVKNAKPMKGGNTDNVYNTGDHRLAFAQSLKDQHPDCVEVVWKFNRWHHQVDYSAYEKNKLIIKNNVTPRIGCNEYNMVLKKIKNETETHAN